MCDTRVAGLKQSFHLNLESLHEFRPKFRSIDLVFVCTETDVGFEIPKASRKTLRLMKISGLSRSYTVSRETHRPLQAAIGNFLSDCGLDEEAFHAIRDRNRAIARKNRASSKNPGRHSTKTMNPSKFTESRLTS